MDFAMIANIPPLATMIELAQIPALGSINLSTLELFLLIGSGLLAIGLLALALTRWGQAKPIWKCVVLSLMAHVLLMAYAYGTHLIWQVPTNQSVDVTDSTRINLVEESGFEVGALENSSLEEESIQKPWMKFVSQQAVPQAEAELELERPLIDSELEITRPEITAPVASEDIAAPRISQLPDLPKPADRNETSDFGTGQFAPDAPVTAQEMSPLNNQATESTAPKMESLPEPARMEADPAPVPQEISAAETKAPFTSELIDDASQLPQADPEPSAAQVSSIESDRTDSQLRVVESPRRLGDGQPIPKLYSLRNRANRAAIVQRRGGSKQTERAVESALVWLSKAQSKDGRWNPRMTEGGKETRVLGHDRQSAGAQADTGISALATLAFLGAGNTHLEGPYRTNVQKGLEFLISKQQQDGSLAGDASLFAQMYCHSMSLLALSEAYALTGDPRLQAAVQRGVNYTVKAQNQHDGSWRYQPGDSGDMSQFGWQVLALHSAELGGAVVPQKTKEMMKRFLKSSTSGVGKGLAAYRPGEGPTATMTAEALVCRYFLQENVERQTSETAASFVGKELPSPTHMNYYYWYYGTMAMYHAGGHSWDKWNESLQQSLLTTQAQTGDQAGSWNPNGMWSSYGGRVYSTAMSALCLEVYYRYLPIYEVAEVPTENSWR